MTIHWHKRAAAQLHEVEDYVLRDFGEEAAADDQPKFDIADYLQQQLWPKPD